MDQVHLEREVTQHFLSAEIRRLRDVKNDFSSKEEYVAYVASVLETLKKYNVVVDAHLSVNDNDTVMISLLVLKTCTESIGTSFRWEK